MTKEIDQNTRERRIRNFIARHKFLSNPKYYKTIKVSVAAYDSWAARGQAGGCFLCSCKSYIYTIYNKRYTTTKQKINREWYCHEIGGNLCPSCFGEVEKQCNYEFKRY